MQTLWLKPWTTAVSLGTKGVSPSRASSGVDVLDHKSLSKNCALLTFGATMPADLKMDRQLIWNGMNTPLKTGIACLAVLAIAAGLASQADAEPYKKKRLRAPDAGKLHSRIYGHRDRDDSIAGYYEHRLDAVRFGSQRWWKIYDEQHGGSNRR
jgi:hypothetical protein